MILISSSGMSLRVPVVRTDASEKRIASIIRVTRIGELGTTLEVTSNRSTLRRNKKEEEEEGISSLRATVTIYC
jgi:hypothetical protein